MTDKEAIDIIAGIIEDIDAFIEDQSKTQDINDILIALGSVLDAWRVAVEEERRTRND